MDLLQDDDEGFVLIGYLLNDRDLVCSKPLGVQLEYVDSWVFGSISATAPWKRRLWPTPRRAHPVRVAVVDLVLTDLVHICSECRTGGHVKAPVIHPGTDIIRNQDDSRHVQPFVDQIHLTLWKKRKKYICRVSLRCFRDPFWLPIISNRFPRIKENYHRVPKIRENRVPRIREIGFLQILTRFLTFSLKTTLYIYIYIYIYIWTRSVKWRYKIGVVEVPTFPLPILIIIGCSIAMHRSAGVTCVLC